jgi:hypothetical protein
MSSRQTYDLEQRERVRQDLLAYKLRHKIGAPALAARIHEANPHIQLIDQRRVSRFLARRHHAEDMFIGWCVTFLEQDLKQNKRLHFSQIVHPIDLFAHGLLEFFGKSGSKELAAEYVVANANETLSFRAPTTLRLKPEQNYWRVEMHAPHAISEGAMVFHAGHPFALLKDRLTGFLSTISVTSSDDTGKMLGWLTSTTMGSTTSSMITMVPR